MTAILRATATLAFLLPIRLTSLAPQRLSADPTPDYGQQHIGRLV